MEAVLERPLDEVGSVPEFNDEEWDRQFGAVGGPAPVKTEQPVTLAQALGLPEAFEDLWPGHCYIPPKITQLETILPLVQQMRDEFLAGNVMESINRAVSVTKMLARRIEGGELIELSETEIKDQFDEDEIANIVNHMMFKQGLVVEGPEGNGPSGRRTGLKNFQRSVASTQDTDSNIAETSPSPSSEGS